MASSTEDGVKEKKQKTQDQDDIPLKAKGESKETVGRKLGSENDDKPRLFPVVAMYGPYNVKDLEPGKTVKWCTCGLSKKQPWCDGSHKGTGFKSLKWKVPETPQIMYSFCGCKYTGSAPLCDATHNDLPCKFKAQQKACTKVHSSDSKLCTGCGWVPQW